MSVVGAANKEVKARCGQAVCCCV